MQVARWQRTAAIFVFLTSVAAASGLLVLLPAPSSLFLLGVVVAPYLSLSALPLFVKSVPRFAVTCIAGAIITGFLGYGPMLWEFVDLPAPGPVRLLIAAWFSGGVAFVPCAPLLLLLALTSPPSPERQMLGLLVTCLAGLVLVGWLIYLVVAAFEG